MRYHTARLAWCQCDWRLTSVIWILAPWAWCRWHRQWCGWIRRWGGTLFRCRCRFQWGRMMAQQYRFGRRERWLRCASINRLVSCGNMEVTGKSKCDTKQREWHTHRERVIRIWRFHRNKRMHKKTNKFWVRKRSNNRYKLSSAIFTIIIKKLNIK